MKRSDDVFFFTLIDFLLQVFFFGLLLSAVWLALASEEAESREARDKQIEEMVKATGVSNLTELTDLLTKMGPVDQLRGTADFIARNGGPEQVERGLKAISAAGGMQKVEDLVAENNALNERVATLEGWGKRSCLPNVLVNGRVTPRTIATARVTDDAVILEKPAEEMHELLRKHGLAFDAVKKLSLSDFRTTLAPIVTAQPDCRYFVRVRRETRYFEPMGAVWAVFRTL